MSQNIRRHVLDMRAMSNSLCEKKSREDAKTYQSSRCSKWKIHSKAPHPSPLQHPRGVQEACNRQTRFCWIQSRRDRRSE